MNIDKQIALKVMGWEYGINTQNCVIPEYSLNGEFIKLAPSWKPSADIQQAFMVVDKLVKDGWFCTLHLYGKLGTQCEFWNMRRKVESNWHQSTALAICRAALKTIKEE